MYLVHIQVRVIQHGFCGSPTRRPRRHSLCTVQYCSSCTVCTAYTRLSRPRHARRPQPTRHPLHARSIMMLAADTTIAVPVFPAGPTRSPRHRCAAPPPLRSRFIRPGRVLSALVAACGRGAGRPALLLPAAALRSVAAPLVLSLPPLPSPPPHLTAGQTPPPPPRGGTVGAVAEMISSHAQPSPPHVMMPCPPLSSPTPAFSPTSAPSTSSSPQPPPPTPSPLLSLPPALPLGCTRRFSPPSPLSSVPLRQRFAPARLPPAPAPPSRPLYRRPPPSSLPATPGRPWR